jgi:hypothetical protein
MTQYHLGFDKPEILPRRSLRGVEQVKRSLKEPRAPLSALVLRSLAAKNPS